MANIKTKQMDKTIDERENQDKAENSQLIEHTGVEGTPFTAVTDSDGTFITLGRYKLTERFDTVENAMQNMEENKWTQILNIVAIVQEKIIEKEKKTP